MNAAALGARATLITVLGDDAEAGKLRKLLEDGAVDAAVVVETGRHTLSKTRVVADGHVLVRVDEGTQSAVSAETEAAICRQIEAQWDRADAVILSDYGYGVLSPAVVATIQRLQRLVPRVLAADSKRLELFRELRPTIVKPNYSQAMALCKVPASMADSSEANPRRAESVRGLAPEILERTGAEFVAVTLDSDGAIVLEAGGAVHRTYAATTDNLRAIGAGDTYLTTFAMALAAGGPAATAACLAARAASVVVRTEGTSYCSRAELWLGPKQRRGPADLCAATPEPTAFRPRGGAADCVYQRRLRHHPFGSRPVPGTGACARRSARRGTEFGCERPAAQGAGAAD